MHDFHGRCGMVHCNWSTRFLSWTALAHAGRRLSGHRAFRNTRVELIAALGFKVSFVPGNLPNS